MNDIVINKMISQLSREMKGMNIRNVPLFLCAKINTVLEKADNNTLELIYQSNIPVFSELAESQLVFRGGIE